MICTHTTCVGCDLRPIPCSIDSTTSVISHSILTKNGRLFKSKTLAQAVLVVVNCHCHGGNYCDHRPIGRDSSWPWEQWWQGKHCPSTSVYLSHKQFYMEPIVRRVSSPLPSILGYPNVRRMLINQIRLEAHPRLKFMVIVNPSSGPGSSKYPNDQYTSALEQLHTYPNVETVGYVRTGYASRDIKDVISEVSVYAEWGSKSDALAMHGIFFDESPHEYSAAAVEFMHGANSAVKNATGLQGDRTVKRRNFLSPLRKTMIPQALTRNFATIMMK